MKKYIALNSPQQFIYVIKSTVDFKTTLEIIVYVCVVISNVVFNAKLLLFIITAQLFEINKCCDG